MLTCAVLFSVSFKEMHPIKLTASLIEYNPKKTSLRMECRVFIDDFENSINKKFTKNISVSNLSKEDIKYIEAYFEKYYLITVNDKKYPLRYKSSEIMKAYNVFVIKFSEDVVTINKGDQVCIENKLFFEDFAFMQSNRVTVRIPPFITENFFETTYKDFSIPINL